MTTTVQAGAKKPFPEETLDRLRAHTEFAAGCWAWTGHLCSTGYGRISVNNHHERTHRVGYMLLVGPIPEGLHLDHLCRNRACWNPKHLEPVTPAENILRGMAPTARNAVKTHCPQGHPYDEANTVIRPSGARRCRACHNASTNRKARNR